MKTRSVLQSKSLGPALISVFSVASVGLMLHGFITQQWWGGFGLVLTMTSALSFVAFANAPTEPAKSQIPSALPSERDRPFDWHGAA